MVLLIFIIDLLVFLMYVYNSKHATRGEHTISAEAQEEKSLELVSAVKREDRREQKINS